MDFDYFRKQSIGLFVGVLISVFLILVNGMGWMEPVYSWGNYLVRPLEYWAGRFSKGIGDTVGTVVEIGNLRADNSELKVELAKLEAQIGDLSEVEKENEALRKQLGIEESQDWELQQVRILGIDREGVAEYVVIDGGEDKGVEKGDAVVLGNILIGEVREVYGSTSRVRLVSNQNSNLSVIDQKTRAKGLVHGSLEGIVMEEVLENEELNEGDTVVTWDDDVPGGLVIGTIYKVEEVPTSSTKKAYIETGFGYEDLNYVFVIVDF